MSGTSPTSAALGSSTSRLSASDPLLLTERRRDYKGGEVAKLVISPSVYSSPVELSIGFRSMNPYHLCWVLRCAHGAL